METRATHRLRGSVGEWVLTTAGTPGVTGLFRPLPSWDPFPCSFQYCNLQLPHRLATGIRPPYIPHP